MKLATVLVLIGWLLIFLSVALLTPIPFGLYYHDGQTKVFLLSSLISLIMGAILAGLWVSEKEMGHREGFLVVSLCWLSSAAIGALPYFLSGAIPGYLDAFFESMSGFTTTGSTILEKVETLSPSLLYWRALTHWLGGMGIIVLSIAILPILGIGGMQLFQAEMPGPTKDRLAPRIQDTARILWGVYLSFTLAEIALLMLAGMNFFDAICTSFATLATGGFATRTESIAYYNSPLIEAIVIIFMILAGINFSLHYRILRGNLMAWKRSEELRFYLIIGFSATFAITFINFFNKTYDSILESLRYAFFQAWAIVTTTGFGTADFDTWAPVCKIILLALMFLGGMAGSTGGGIKQMRILLFWKYAKVQIKKLIHPKAVDAIKLDKNRVPSDVMLSILGFFALYIVAFLTATLIVTAQGLDIVTGATAVIATLNNIGPGLGGVGPVKNFAAIPDFSKFVLIICMMAGRLELYTLAVLFAPSYWKGIYAPKWRWQSKKE